MAVRIGVALTAALVALPGPRAAGATGGRVSTLDADFCAELHRVAMYAVAAGELAEAAGGEVPVRTVSAKIAAQDRRLDGTVRTVATKLGLPLPADPQPSPRPLMARKGATFDAAYVDQLRRADGDLLRDAAAVRVSTRNGPIRDLAHQTVVIVMSQLSALDGSGLVDFTALPTPTPPAGPSAGHGGPSIDPAMVAQARAGEGFLWPSLRVALLVLSVAVLGGTATAWRIVARRPQRARYRGRKPGRGPAIGRGSIASRRAGTRRRGRPGHRAGSR